MGQQPRAGAERAPDVSRRLLAVYANDHLALSTGTLELARRVARTGGASVYGDGFDALVAALAQDRRTLRQLMHRHGLAVRRYKQLVAHAGERLGRLKLNGSLVRPSPLRRLVEHEGLLLGVEGCLQFWRTLAAAGLDEEVAAEATRRLESARALLDAADAELRPASLRE